MTLLRELGRRKLRTTLTILGITIGIWALVVFSSMANKINTLVASGSDYYVGKVVVTDGSTNGLGIGLIPIDLALAGQITAMDGVAAVDSQVQMPYANEGINGFGIPKMIQGQVAGADQGMDRFPVHVAQGRLLDPGDEGTSVTVLGSDLARELGAGVGDNVVIRDVSFEVVGILQPILTAADMTAMLPLAAAQELFLATLPPTLSSALDASQLASMIVVYPGEGTNPDALADRIEATAEQVTTMTAADFDQQVGSTTLTLRSLTFRHIDPTTKRRST